MRKELSVYTSWFNEHRPHQSLDGRTPLEVYKDLVPASQQGSVEPRMKRPTHREAQVALSVTYYAGRPQLPIITLQRAA